MNNLLSNITSDEIKNAASSMIISTVKSIARHNKRAAELLLDAKRLINPDTDQVEKHNSFLDEVIQILKPVLHIAHSVLEKLFPSYMHIIDWIIGLFTDVVNGATA